MKTHSYVLLAVLAFSSSIQADVFSIRPDWQQLTLQLISDKKIQEIIQDKKLIADITKKVEEAEKKAGPAKIEDLQKILKSPEGQKLISEVQKQKDVFLREVQDQLNKHIDKIAGINCSSSTCSISPFTMQIGDKTLKADRFDVPYKNGKINMLEGTGTNTVLIDPKLGDINLGQSQIKIQDNKSDIDLNIQSSTLNYNQDGKKILDVPGGVKLNTKISNNSNSQIYHLDLKSNSGFTYQEMSGPNNLVSVNSTTPISLSLQENKDTGSRRIFAGTDDPNGVVSYSQVKGNSKVVATATGETYFLSDGGQGLLSAKNVVVQKDQTQGNIQNLEIRNNGQLISGNANKVNIQQGSNQLQLNDFKFAYDKQNQSTNLRVQELSGRSGNSNVSGTNMNLNSKNGVQTVTWDQINIKQGNQQLSNTSTFLEFEKKDKVVSGRIISEETLFSNGNSRVVLKGLEGVFNVGDEKNFRGSLQNLTVKSGAINLNLEAINSNGMKEKFQLRILEKDGERLYQVFGENGNLVKIDASTDKYMLSAITESISYFESPQGKQLLVKNFSGKLKDSENKYLGDFSFKSGQYFQSNGQEVLLAHAGNVQKDGLKLSFDDLEIKRDKNTEFYKIANSNLTYSWNKNIANMTGISGELVRQKDSVNGSLKFSDFNGSYQNTDFQAKNGQAQFFSSGNEKLGMGTLDQLNVKRDNQYFAVTGAEVLYKQDNQGKVILGKAQNLSADIQGYKVDVVIKDNKLNDQKIQVQVVESGSERYYKIFNEKGQEIAVNASKDKNTYQALFKNIEYLSTPEFKSFVADNLSVSGKHDDIQGSLKTQKIEFHETPLIKSGKIDALEFNISKNNLSAQGTLGQAIFNQSAAKDEAALAKGRINLVDKNLSGGIIFENALYQKLKEPGNEVTLVRFDNTQLVAIEDKVFKASAHIGNANYLQNKEMTVIELNSIKDLKIDDLKNKISANAGMNRLIQIKTKDQNGKPVSYYLLEGGKLDITSPESSTLGQISLKMDGLFGEFTQSGKDFNGAGKVGTASGNYQGTSFQASNGQVQINSSNNQQSGKVTLDQLNLQRDAQTLKITGAEVLYKGDNQGKVILGGAQSVNAMVEGYKVDVLLKDKSQKDQKIQVQVIESGNQKFYKIFNEKGQEIAINASKDKNTYQALFKNIEYLTTPEFKSFVADNLSVTGKHQDIQGTLKTQRIEFVETPLIKSGKIDGLEFKVSQNTLQGQGTIGQAIFNQTAQKDEASITQGKINLVDKKLKGDLSFENALYQKIKEPNNEITLIRFDNNQLVAVEENVFKASLKFGNASYLQDKDMTVIQVNSLKDIKLDDLKNKISASGNVSKLVQIKTKDANGQPVSYYLMEGAEIDISSPKMSVLGQISAKFLEVTQVGGKTVFGGDIKGSVQYQGPININGTGTLQGKDLTFNSQKVSTPKLVSHYYSIESVTDTGGINLAKLQAGPDFLKDMISFEAKGNAGKKLDFTFVQDKAQGTYYLKAEFKEGDKIKVKLFPFTLESKKSGDSAKIELNITPKGQNFMNHLDIITSIVDSHEITNFLEISSGGMLTVKSPTMAGFGLEVMYQDHTVFNPGITPSHGAEKAATYGAGVFYRGEKGSETSAGLMLSGDSEFNYQTNGRGVLKVMGMNMPEQGSIPATMNFYFKHRTAAGNTAFASIFYDLTSPTVDPKVLSKDSQYYQGGRGQGGAGFSVGYSHQINDRTRLTVAGGMNNNFQDPAICATLEMQIGGGRIRTLARDVGEINDFLQIPANPYGGRSVAMVKGPTAEGARELHWDRLSFLSWEIEKSEAAQELVALFDKLIIKHDEEVLRKIRQWENRNLLSKQDEKLVKLAFGDMKAGSHSAHIPNLEHWRKIAAKSIDLKKYGEYKKEYEELSKKRI